MKAYGIANNKRTRCISPKRSSYVISHLVPSYFYFVSKIPAVSGRKGKFQTVCIAFTIKENCITLTILIFQIGSRQIPLGIGTMNTRGIVILAIGGLSVLTNGILLVILYLDPLKKFRTTTSYLIISLTISDFLTGGVACAYAFARADAFFVTDVILYVTILSSTFAIFFMACERLVVVTYPLKAKSLITRRRIRLFIAANWLASSVLGGLMGALPHSQKSYLRFSLFSAILILVLVLVVIYFMIIWRTKHRPTFSSETMCTRSLRIIQREQRLTRALLLLIAVLMVTVVPYFTAHTVDTGYLIFSDHIYVPYGVMFMAKYYFPIELLNFVVNPIIYAWRLPDYRQSLYFYLRKSRHPDVSNGVP